MQRVFLEPVNSLMYDNNNEPQYVQIRSCSTANIYINSDDNELQTNKVNMQVSTIKSLTDYPSQLTNNIQRIRFSEFSINRWNIPNVNIRNNTITIYSSISSLFHTIIIQEGFYTTEDSLMDAVRNGLNAITGLTGLTFSWSYAPLSASRRYILSSITGSFYIKNDCTAVLYGKNCFGFSEIQTPSLSISVTPFLVYTSFIDVCSSTINKFTKLRSTATNQTQDVIFRAYLNTDILRTPQNDFRAELSREPVSRNYYYDQQINIIDFQLKDQYGFFLYQPNYDNSFSWSAIITVEN